MLVSGGSFYFLFVRRITFEHAAWQAGIFITDKIGWPLSSACLHLWHLFPLA